ncbi:MAG: hypothetical protein HFI30_02550 [Lachnospiraceae bacterium]|jgi:hypothetical protein|nr:hypothetical protein [Lachnospiraceae bacterium]
MSAGYTDTPHNMEEIAPYVIVEKKDIAAEILERKTCYFYDTCSFRRYSNLNREEAEYFLKYVKAQDGILVLNRCILMELASHSGVLNPEYVRYIKYSRELGIPILVLYEEDLFSVMDLVFSTNAAINTYLCWAVRSIRGPVSTITETLEQNARLYDEVIRGKNLDHRDMYQRFFQAVRQKKEAGDHLGEELLAICLHILSYLPGEEDGKFNIITDDKGAAGKIDQLFKKTARQYKGKRVGIFSTPKIVQILHREKILENREHMKAILSTGTEGNLAVLGARIFDVRSQKISIDAEQLTDLILEPNGIQIIF